MIVEFILTNGRYVKAVARGSDIDFVLGQVNFHFTDQFNRAIALDEAELDEIGTLLDTSGCLNVDALLENPDDKDPPS